MAYKKLSQPITQRLAADVVQAFKSIGRGLRTLTGGRRQPPRRRQELPEQLNEFFNWLSQPTQQPPGRPVTGPPTVPPKRPPAPPSDGGYRTPPPPGGGDGDDQGGPPVNQPAGGRFTPVEPQIREILTPQSSNVYSFAYHRRQGDKLGTLYVRFKGHIVNPHSTHVGGGTLGGRQQLHGALGRTVGRKTDEPGALYAYYAVPVEIYNKMQSAQSKGTFVWDALRIRGTIYGHQYRYQLVAGFETAGSKGFQYIPRRATKEGFKVRSVADVGTSRRGYVSSTLPSQIGHVRRIGGN